MSEKNEVTQPGEAGEGKYTVVARRYRPKTFNDLVGQDTVAQALLRAIETHRVGHAYLFTGARGVGKTSTARIFAKALNASEDGTGRFDPDSEIAHAIDSGEDMDVIEIDGASNRGIDEIRQLRANASIRPTRSRFKIYIIDEVHMLTTPAFNALLKTLEEPPGHVKFIFCTTDPEKIPITVLSRCQRFDFPPVRTEQILQRLRFICEQEGASADEEALRLIARRAAGSMRDSQSLLEQLLSFGGHRITVDDVHAMLGTADENRLASLALSMIQRDPSRAIVELDAAMGQGVDPGQLAEQLLGYLRDMMALAVGGPVDLVRTANPNNADALRQSGQAWGSMTLLSAMQLLDESIVRMKHSVQPRILLEVALVQICSLQDLQLLSDVVNGLAAGRCPPVPPRSQAAVTITPLAPPINTPTPTTPTSRSDSLPRMQDEQEIKKKEDDVIPAGSPGNITAEPTQEPTTPAAEEHTTRSAIELTAPSAHEYLKQAVASMEGIAQQAGWMTLEVQPQPDHRWRILLAREAKFAVDWFRKPENEELIRNALFPMIGVKVSLEWVLTDRVLPPGAKPSEVLDGAPPPPPSDRQSESNQRIREAMVHPLIQRFIHVFDAHVLRVDPPASLSVPAPKSQTLEISDRE